MLYEHSDMRYTTVAKTKLWWKQLWWKPRFSPRSHWTAATKILSPLFPMAKRRRFTVSVVKTSLISTAQLRQKQIRLFSYYTHELPISYFQLKYVVILPNQRPCSKVQSKLSTPEFPRGTKGGFTLAVQWCVQCPPITVCLHFYCEILIRFSCFQFQFDRDLEFLNCF